MTTLTGNPAQLPGVVDIAIRTALARRGVAHLTFPNDVQVADADADRTSTSPPPGRPPPPYSPAATSAATASRTSRRPSRSSEETGSSNQRTSRSAAAAMVRMACLRPQPPLASTNSWVPPPTVSRAWRIRARSRASLLPHDSPTLILTRGMRCPDTQSPSCSRSSPSP